MRNLLQETLSDLRELGLKESDVDWCGSEKFGYFSWEDFKGLADYEYDAGYGGHKVASDLLIVLKDNSWLERGEYDGSEWWEYKKTPIKPQNYNNPNDLFMGCL